MPTRTLPEWETVLSSAARLQRILPDAVLVGGTAAAIHVGHRFSRDADRCPMTWTRSSPHLRNIRTSIRAGTIGGRSGPSVLKSRWRSSTAFARCSNQSAQEEHFSHRDTKITKIFNAICRSRRSPVR
ncbi:hypothetical protein THSYN_16995 [Candidatus Thiodictyon syntrophicum]|uniref:Uncharacterized protein n=1 Tax=Candidatus Thiodictyon syntrophicum TaxID=1166950 RepID=A0A2K8UBR7_9GAMM|nr:hypothetical protein THSYN_16995 [Candidatus Thiodictyon syntrophicum]